MFFVYRLSSLVCPARTGTIKNNQADELGKTKNVKR